MSLSADLRDVSATFSDGDWYGTHPYYPPIKASSYDDALMRMRHYIQNLWLDLEQVEDFEEDEDDD